MTQTSVFKHQNVHGKELYYLKIVKNNNTVLINIGKRTYDKIENLNTNEETKTLDNQNNKR